jgi:hypothetical protein
LPEQPDKINFHCLNDQQLTLVSRLLTSDSEILKRISIETDVENTQVLFNEFKSILENPAQFITTHFNNTRNEFKQKLNDFFNEQSVFIDNDLECEERNCLLNLTETKKQWLDRFRTVYSRFYAKLFDQFEKSKHQGGVVTKLKMRQTIEEINMLMGFFKNEILANQVYSYSPTSETNDVGVGVGLNLEAITFFDAIPVANFEVDLNGSVHFNLNENKEVDAKVRNGVYLGFVKNVIEQDLYDRNKSERAILNYLIENKQSKSEFLKTMPAFRFYDESKYKYVNKEMLVNLVRPLIEAFFKYE